MKSQVNKYQRKKWEREKEGTYLGKHKNQWEWCPWSEIPKDRTMETVMARLRLGHTKLNAHMYKMKLIENPNCTYCQTPETIEYYLMNCHRHYTARCILKSKLIQLGISPINPSTMLGGGDWDTETKYKITQAVINYIKQTGKQNEI